MRVKCPNVIWASFPRCPRNFGGVGLVGQPPSEHEQRIGQSVQKPEYEWVNRLHLVQCNASAFGPATCGAGKVCIGGGRMASGQHKARQCRQTLFQLVHPGFKIFWTVGLQGRQFGKPIGVGGGQVAAHGEQFALDLLEFGANRRCRCVCGKFANPCVEFVQGAVGFDPQIVFSDACTSEQAGASIVSCACVYAHAASYNGRVPARLGVPLA